jgi:hypothetical protein
MQNNFIDGIERRVANLSKLNGARCDKEIVKTN